MTALHHALDFFREVVVAALAQRVFAIVTVLVVAGSTSTVLATAGRSAAAQEAVLSQIDAQGTRTIVVQAKGSQPGMTTSMVDCLTHLNAVEAVIGLGAVTDATAAALPQGQRIGVRLGHGRINGADLFQPVETPGVRTAWASAASARVAGIPPGAGAIRLIDGEDLLVTRNLQVPAYLEDLEPLTLIPADRSTQHGPEPVATMVVLARTPQDVSAVAGAVRAMLADVPPDGATVQSSAAMADLRAAIGGELSRQSRGVVLGLLAAVTAATLLNVWGMVLLRRKDFGRRRALGATRLTIVLLIVLQVLLVAVIGVLAGAAAGMSWLAFNGDALPTLSYAGALCVALVSAAAAAAAVPAAYAARRDPIAELRVP
jgi:putative ABC transport system permease protein